MSLDFLIAMFIEQLTSQLVHSGYYNADYGTYCINVHAPVTGGIVCFNILPSESPSSVIEMINRYIDMETRELKDELLH